MPITLEKLFSPTLETTFEFLEESVTMVWRPWVWTGEMQELAEEMQAEYEAEQEAIEELKAAGDKEAAQARGNVLEQHWRVRTREFLARLLVSWDVLDGKTPVGTDLATLKTLPDMFLLGAFNAILEASQPDPQKAPSSEKPSNSETGSAPSQAGTTSLSPLEPSASRRSTSTNGHNGHVGIRPGATGRSSAKRPSRRQSSTSRG